MLINLFLLNTSKYHDLYDNVIIKFLLQLWIKKLHVYKIRKYISRHA